MKNTFFIVTVLLACFFLPSCSEDQDAHIKAENTREVISYKVLPFDLKDVKLLPGPFKQATELDEKTLLGYDPDRLLSKFRIEAGLKPKAEHYGGWENETLAGHSLGHYLSACALMFNSITDSVFLDRVNYIVSELDTCQKAEGSGYLGAVPGAKKVFEEEVAKGDIRSKGFDLNGIWAPIYTQHKIMAGLLDAYELCSNEKALSVAEKFAGWMESYLSKMTHEQIQEMMHCEIGGISESMAELYALTGKQKYLDMNKTFYHEEILVPLSEGKDILPGKHANTQIPKIIGLSRDYELTGNQTDYKTIKFFWDRVVHHHSYVTGGHCDHEYFGPPDTLRNRLSEGTTETCNVYNMLKLSKHIFEWEASAEVADFYERALFNHILSSQHPKTGKVVYNLSLDMGGYKEFQDPEWFTCCIGTGMESHAKYGWNIYYHNNEELYVSQFIASELTWKEKGLVLKQTTSYPEEQASRLEFTVDKPLKLSLKIRCPYWATKGYAVKVNGKAVNTKNIPGSFVTVERTWKTGDVVEIAMPFEIRYEPMPDDKDRIAILYGPLVLAGELGPVDTNADVLNPMFVPVFIADKNKLESWIVPVENQVNTFKTDHVGRPRDVVLEPFYKTNDIRYSVYWDIFTEEKWEQAQKDYQRELEEKKKMQALTIDFFQPGEMQPERDHNFKENRSWVGEHKGRKFRETGDFISCALKTRGNDEISILVDYWSGFPGSKTFDILVDSVLIKTENISNLNDGKFITQQYQIPSELIKGKQEINVVFKAHEGHRAGPIFGVRTIRGSIDSLE
jgi:uncharacterized protein